MKKWMRITAAFTAVCLLMLCFAGCGGKKSSFKVDKEKLPKGVVQIDTGVPNKALVLGEVLTQEALRRYVVANTYTQAVLHYDFKKGNAKDFAALATKMKKAWVSGKDAATFATYYNIKLGEMSRRSNYQRYSQLETPGISFMSTACAAKKVTDKDGKVKMIRSKSDIYTYDNKIAIKKFIDAYPEEKQLLAMTKVLHTDFATACNVMKDIYPERIGGGEGRSWEDIGTDILYRSAHVAKTVGKAAGIGIAVLTMPATGGASMALAAGAGLVKIADTTLDAAQTAHVLVTGEEVKLLNKALKVTEAADTVCGVMTFSVNANKISKSLTEGSAELANMARTGDVNNITTAIQLNNITSQGAAWGSFAVADEQGEETVLTVIKEAVDDTGRQLRTTAVPVNKLNTPESKEKLAALDMTPEEAVAGAEAAKAGEAARATTNAEDYVRTAEAVRDAGDGKKFGEEYDKAMAKATNTLAAALGVSGKALDTLIQQMARDEMNNISIIAVQDEQGNTKAVIVVKNEGSKASAPYAVENVVGDYDVKHVWGTTKVHVSNSGGKLHMSYNWKGEYASEAKAGAVSSYNENTGVGTFGEYQFRFSGTKGNMSLSIIGKTK